MRQAMGNLDTNLKVQVIFFIYKLFFLIKRKKFISSNYFLYSKQTHMIVEFNKIWQIHESET